MKSAWYKGIDKYLEDPAASDWFKMVLKSALQRDPVDALNDVEVLLDCLHLPLLEPAPMKKRAAKFPAPRNLPSPRTCRRCKYQFNEHGLCGCIPMDDEIV